MDRRGARLNYLMDVGERILKPRKDVNHVLFARFDEREEDAAGLRAKLVTMGEPVFRPIQTG